ncbi:pentapeptide repeat-containing protein [Streptomyces sp. FH025]|uniref:pentapeptide repeat-containing protein n=1 Tax=Streptomyces sp. FH025 TaxID=2815937 RepID=UPI001A9E7FAB|nr:pentapeptide repeat-containing protein [Streptomyces sp. FH025]MBO1416714.1 pentapeptide repeat-containing protein [Streptomyces sp. FH025]
MPTRAYGRTAVLLPDLDNDPYLGTITSVPRPGSTVTEFRYTDQDLRDLDLIETDVRNGVIHNVSSQRTHIDNVRFSSVQVTDSNFGQVQWTGTKASRTVFRNCKLMGAVIGESPFDNVLFENCRLDYVVFGQIRATGALVFDRCVLTEATFTGADLTGAVFRDCTLRAAEFGPGKYKNCDLTGNDLSTVRGVANLREVIINHGQQAQLADALLAELDVTYADDLPDYR